MPSLGAVSPRDQPPEVTVMLVPAMTMCESFEIVTSFPLLPKAFLPQCSLGWRGSVVSVALIYPFPVGLNTGPEPPEANQKRSPAAVSAHALVPCHLSGKL